MRLLLFIVAAVALLLGSGCSGLQRQLLYHPSHHDGTNGLAEWRHGNQLIGYAREMPLPRNVWLLLHGNAGQAVDRVYALPSFSPSDSVYILEYPGYGLRAGTPSLPVINAAAREAYELLRAGHPGIPVCVAGESIGTGPACALVAGPRPPDKLVLVTPFDVLARVAAEHFPRAAVSALLSDNWNNIEALKGYTGPLEIFGAKGDTVIPIQHARALADSKPGAVFHQIDGGHNDWSRHGRVTIRNP